MKCASCHYETLTKRDLCAVSFLNTKTSLLFRNLKQHPNERRCQSARKI